MIKFADIPANESTEKSEVLSLQEESNLADKARADLFWNTVFQEETPEQEIDMDSLLIQVFDRSEDEFSFDYELTDELRSLVSIFTRADWNFISFGEKCGLINDLAEEIEAMLQISEKPQIVFFDGPDTSCGAFNKGNNTIEVNRKLLDNPVELLDTIAHELRHAYQHQKANNPETLTDLLYAVNFDNYISPVQYADGKYLFFTDYMDQLVEAEARAFAKFFVNMEGSFNE